MRAAWQCLAVKCQEEPGQSSLWPQLSREEREDLCSPGGLHLLSSPTKYHRRTSRRKKLFSFEFSDLCKIYQEYSYLLREQGVQDPARYCWDCF